LDNPVVKHKTADSNIHSLELEYQERLRDRVIEANRRRIRKAENED
jgi:hypothetical protein